MSEVKLCSGISKSGGCSKPVVRDHDGIQVGEYCMFHGGWRTLKAKAKQAKFNYYLGAHQERVRDLATSPSVKSLREEIGVLRMFLEFKINSLDANDEFEFLKATPIVADLIDRIDRLVNSCTKIETSLGLTLDKSQVSIIADQISDVISLALQDTELSEEETTTFLEKVTNGIARALCPPDDKESHAQEPDFNK